jgi:Protein of unknown function (DUF1579)
MCAIYHLAAVVLLTAPLAAVGSEQQQMPKPAPEMAQVSYFEGTWACEGKMFETPMGPAGTMKTTAEIRRDLNGFVQTGTIKGTSPNMPPFEGRFHATYDSGMKQYVMLWVDNMGGWAQTMSSGWKSDSMVFEGEAHMGGHSMKSRETFMKSGPASMKRTFEAQIDGKWVTASEETCQKK